MEIAGKHVFITGASRRVGRAIAEHFLQWPIKLSAHYHTAHEEAAQLVALAHQKSSQAIAVQADLGKPSEITNAVQTAYQTHGPIDILINCASIFHKTPTLTCEEKDWDLFLNINLKGQFFFARETYKRRDNKRQVILNVADVHATKPIPQFTPYAASKAALVMISRNLAKEWAPHTRVNTISPGPVLLPENYTPEQTARSAERTLLKRIGTPLDIAHGAEFLIRNDYITGFDLIIDGGRTHTA